MSAWAKKVLKLLFIGEVVGFGQLVLDGELNWTLSLGLSSGVSILLDQIMVLKRSYCY